jgi:hypothetical protein
VPAGRHPAAPDRICRGLTGGKLSGDPLLPPGQRLLAAEPGSGRIGRARHPSPWRWPFGPPRSGFTAWRGWGGVIRPGQAFPHGQGRAERLGQDLCLGGVRAACPVRDCNVVEGGRQALSGLPSRKEPGGTTARHSPWTGPFGPSRQGFLHGGSRAEPWAGFFTGCAPFGPPRTGHSSWRGTGGTTARTFFLK